MANVSVVDQIVQSLSFEVEAVPQEHATKLSGTSNSTPLNVRIKVRKKEECGMQQGFLSVPKFGRPEASPERVRLISSDQTIMSFDVSMEADFEKKPKRKPRKSFFGGCLGTQYDDDDVPYTPNTTYNAKITDTSTPSKSDGRIRQQFTLSKTNYDNTNALQHYTKKQSILGKCKPGGCLDPPFSEEKYSYEPQNFKDKTPSFIEDPVKKKGKIKLGKADGGHKTAKGSKRPSKDSMRKTGDDSSSILSIYDNSLKGFVDSKYSDSVITYPPLMAPSDVSYEKSSRNKISEEKPRRSYNDTIEAFFTSPKKSNRFSNDKNSSGTENVQKEKAKTSVPIAVPAIIPMVDDNIISKTDNSRIMKLRSENLESPTESLTDKNKKQIDKTALPIPDDTSLSKLDELHVTAPYVREPILSKLDTTDTQSKAKTGLTPHSTLNVATVFDYNKQNDITPHAQDLNAPKDLETDDKNKTKMHKTEADDLTSSSVPLLINDPLLSSTEHLTPNIRDQKSIRKTDSSTIKVEIESSVTSVTEKDNTTLKSDKVYITKQHDLHSESPKEVAMESEKNNAGPKSDKVYTTKQHDLDSESPKEAAMESEKDNAGPKSDQVYVIKQHGLDSESLKEAAMESDKDNTGPKSDKVYTTKQHDLDSASSKEAAMESEKDNDGSKSDQVYIAKQHDRDLKSPKEATIEPNGSDITGIKKGILPTNDLKVDQSSKRSSNSNASIKLLQRKEYDRKNTAIKILSPEINAEAVDPTLQSQSSPDGSLKSEIIDSVKSKNNATFSEPYISNDNRIFKFDMSGNEEIDDYHQNASQQNKKYSDVEKFKPGKKTQIHDSEDDENLEKNTMEQSLETLNENKSIKGIETDFIHPKSLSKIPGRENQQFLTDRITKEHDENKILSKSDEICQENLKPLNKLKFFNEPSLTKDDSQMENNEAFEFVNEASKGLTKPNEHIEYEDNDNKNKIWPVKSENYELHDNNIEDTMFNYENNFANNTAKDDQDTEGLKVYTFMEPVYKEDSERYIDRDDNNLTRTPEYSTQVSTTKQASLKSDSFQIQKFQVQRKSSKDSSGILKHGSFDRESFRHASRNIFIQEEKPTELDSKSSQLEDPTRSSEYMQKSKTAISTRRISPHSPRHSTDSVLQKLSNGEANLEKTDSKHRADKEVDTSAVSSKMSLKRDYILLNLGFQSYVNDRNERSLRTIDLTSDNVRYLDDSVTVIQSQLRPDVNEIRIPIDSDNDLTIQIHQTKSPTQSGGQTARQEPLEFDKAVTSMPKRYGLPQIPNANNYDSHPQEWHEKINCNEIPTILNSVYEQELVPLQKTIDHLKKEIDHLAGQQTILIEQLVNVKRSKPVRLLRVNSRCACFR